MCWASVMASKFYVSLACCQELCCTIIATSLSAKMCISTQTTNTAVTSTLQRELVLKIPIAHGEGRFFADADTLKRLNENDQILFRYCDEEGQITAECNPNGAEENIAGICNEKRNVFGMMPHPERAADQELSNTDGRTLFEGILNTLELA